MVIESSLNTLVPSEICVIFCLVVQKPSVFYISNGGLLISPDSNRKHSASIKIIGISSVGVNRNFSSHPLSVGEGTRINRSHLYRTLKGALIQRCCSERNSLLLVYGFREECVGGGGGVGREGVLLTC